MKLKDIHAKLSKSFFEGMSVSFFEETTSTLSLGQIHRKQEIVSFSIKNNSAHRYAKNLVCSFVKSIDSNEVYFEIWWFQSPGAKMICFNEKICDNIEQLEDQKSKLINAIEYGITVVENLK
jgi:hypothetical protein